MIKAILALGLLSIICGATSPPRRRYLPAYLEKVPEKARKDYFEIQRDPSNTFAQLKEKTIAWAKKNDVTEEYNKYMSGLEKSDEDRKKKVSEIMSRLPAVYSEYTKILNNMNQTMKDWLKNFTDLWNKNPKVSFALQSSPVMPRSFGPLATTR
ncbi:hypothetical protein OESDEN_06866 [Oesophagostomum dentatum]|uniref:SXP/RAL-2 family protein Ani s 5-like cation-binding domain-containing protein n=1 Tax=Oesophagostomum dentatum TaxID=61180 RepID=A0A0B1T6Q4_OESDE|nr:hypothetical protein OESDEN_06866 [Oesophagostomum dentatum]